AGLNREVNCFSGGQRQSGYSLTQRFAFDVLGRQEVSRLDLPDVKDGNDIRMVKRGRSTRFALKPANAVVVSGEGCGEKLEGNFTTKTRIFREVDLTHSAGTEQRQYSVMTYLAACPRWGMFFSHCTASSKRPVSNGQFN